MADLRGPATALNIITQGLLKKTESEFENRMRQMERQSDFNQRLQLALAQGLIGGKIAPLPSLSRTVQPGFGPQQIEQVVGDQSPIPFGQRSDVFELGGQRFQNVFQPQPLQPVFKVGDSDQLTLLGNVPKGSRLIRPSQNDLLQQMMQGFPSETIPQKVPPSFVDKKVGDIVVHQGRRFRIRGFFPDGEPDVEEIP